jgi:aminoglycoside phosphotransferase (APT) family kinase protein
MAGLDPEGASLLRLGENALYRLASAPAVVRVARTMDYWDDAAKEAAVSRWLAGAELPAAKLYGEFDQPLAAAGHPVTIWRFIPGRSGTPAEIATLAGLLRRLHALPPPTGFRLPEVDILGRVESRIRAAVIPAVDREFLHRRLAELRQALPDLRFPLSPGPIHGDAHVQNVMIADGTPTLIDFERFGLGQPEWDVSVTATEYLTAGWWTPDQYATFCDAYGFDVTQWSGFDVLRRTNELKMVSWLMQNIAQSEEIAYEYRARMATLRGRIEPGSWRAF